jgi:hypothetical protein
MFSTTTAANCKPFERRARARIGRPTGAPPVFQDDLGIAIVSAWATIFGLDSGSIIVTNSGTIYNAQLAANQIYGISGGTVLGNGGGGLTYTPNTPQLFGNILDGSNAHLYLNSGTEQGSPVPFGSTIGSGGTYLELSGTNTTACYVIVTTVVMNPTDIANLKTWTNTNWGTSF